MAGRTFIVRISDSPRRVTIEDVRTRHRVLPPDLDAVGPAIAELLREPAQDQPPLDLGIPQAGDEPVHS
jgi:hypothetical protein